MRMSQYYLSLLSFALLGLAATALAGVSGSGHHLTIALPTALVVVGLHSSVILFALIGSRLMREAANNCGLSADYLDRSNAYFRRVSGLFLSLGGAFSIVAAAVLGYGNRAFGLPPEVHLLVGIGAAALTLISIPYEYATLKSVERLLDQSRAALEAQDQARAAQGLEPVDADCVPQKDSPVQIAIFVTMAPLMAYLYRGLIVWQGRFDQVSVHPWIEIAAVGLVLWIRARRRASRGQQN